MWNVFNETGVTGVGTLIQARMGVLSVVLSHLPDDRTELPVLPDLPAARHQTKTNMKHK